MIKNKVSSLPAANQLDWQLITSGLRARTNLRAGKPLGDCVADFTHFTGIDKAAEFYTEVTGKDCGCKRRQDWLNEHGPDFLGK